MENKNTKIIYNHVNINYIKSQGISQILFSI